MNEDQLATTVLLAVLGVLLPLVVTQATFKAREMEDAWRRLAERHRLHYERVGLGKFHVIGALRDRRFELRLAGKKSKKQGATMELELSTAPVGLKIRSIGKHVAEHIEVLGEPKSEQDDKTGAISINGEAEVSAVDRDELRIWLTPRRKRAALDLAHIGGELSGRTLAVSVVTHVVELEELDGILRTLDEVAGALDRQTADGSASKVSRAAIGGARSHGSVGSMSSRYR